MMYDVACSCARVGSVGECKAVGWRGCVHYNGIVIFANLVVGRNVLRMHWCSSRFPT
jgi:hypothetical protein